MTENLDGGLGDVVAVSKKPEDTAFKQQRLPAVQPTMSPPFIIACFTIIGTIFIPLGAAIIVASDGIVEYTVRYDHLQNCPFSSRMAALGYACPPLNVTFDVNQTMPAPVFISYQIENFYQNHRRYAKSKADVQISGDMSAPDAFTDCSPLQYVTELMNPADNSSRQVAFDSSSTPTVSLDSVVYNPCGLIAWSMFNDSFVLSRTDGVSTSTIICDGEAFTDIGDPKNASTVMPCVKKGIAWSSDVGVKYVAVPPPYTKQLSYQGWPLTTSTNTTPLATFVKNGWYLNEVGHRIPNPIDEDFMVWMRIASLSSFRKLYRRITVDVLPGLYQISIKQRSDYRAFNGKKTFVLSTCAWIGGKNYLLGGVYVASGATALIVAIAFLVKHMTTPKRVGSL